MLLSLPVSIASADVSALPAGEKSKIESLIRNIEALADARFVRNGVEYDSKTAAKFLRGKWQSKEDGIRSAKDFIAKAATASSSGKPYRIRRKGGPETSCAEYLEEELRKLEAAPKP